MLGLSILSRHHHHTVLLVHMEYGGCVKMLHFLFCFKGLKRHGMRARPDALEADNHGGNVCPWKVFWMPSFFQQHAVSKNVRSTLSSLSGLSLLCLVIIVLLFMERLTLIFFSTNHHGYQLFCSSSFFVTQKDALTSHLDKLKRFVK